MGGKYSLTIQKVDLVSDKHKKGRKDEVWTRIVYNPSSVNAAYYTFNFQKSYLFQIRLTNNIIVKITVITLYKATKCALASNWKIIKRI